MEEHYLRWSDSDLVEQFANKAVGEFFRTEQWALKKMGGMFDSVLDIGCASGRMVELLKCYTEQLSYTGVDISVENIERARTAYPEAEFYLANGLDFNPNTTFSLVNATGVCQHEPHFDVLIRRMVEMSSRFVMFDVKFAVLNQPLIDREQSYCQFSEHRLFYVLLALKPFVKFLETLPDVACIEVWGYDTSPSSRAIVPSHIKRLVSAGVFIEKGNGPCRVKADLPSWLGAV